MSYDEGEPRFSDLPVFPSDAEPPLPPRKAWPLRLAGLTWQLFPTTIVCVPLFGFLGLLCFGVLLVGMMDWRLGFLGGLMIGAVVGIVIDVKHSLLGGTIDE